MSYAALAERVEALAEQLAAQGIGRGHTVGVCLERSAELIVAILAVLRAGAAYVPLDASYPAARLEDMAKDAKLAALLTREALRDKLPPLPGVLTLTRFEHAPKGTRALPVRAAEDLVYVIFTSGSTGRPKGVALGEAALVNLIEWQRHDSRLGAGARTLQFAPVSFDVHFQEIFATLTTGGALVLIDEDTRTDTLRLLRTIEAQAVERLFLPFVALQSLAEMATSHALYPASLREIVTAGEQLRITPQLVQLFTALQRCTLANHYGPSETHVVTALTLQGPPESWPALPSIGRPLPGCAAHLLDEAGQPADEGELWLSGVCLAQGYIGRDDLTRERFLPLPGIGRAYRTGDLARRQPNGELDFLGRIDGQVKIRGFRVELGEVEVALSQAPFVKQAAVTAREDTPGHKRLVAYVVLNQALPNFAAELRSAVQRTLPDYMVPQAFVALDELPRTPSGKVDRKRLPAPSRKRPQLVTAYVAAESESERALASVWREVLGLDDPPGVNDNFFELGGNSLLAVQAVARSKRLHGMDLSVVQLFETPTIDGLMRQLGDDPPGERRSAPLRAAAPSTGEEPIAIVGMAVRMPGAANLTALWDNLCRGVESVRRFAPHELDPTIPRELRDDRAYVPARGVIDGADGFDAAFFGINPSEAAAIDPQQRLLLELSVHALEHAGHAPGSFDPARDGSVGVFAGTHNNSYYLENVRRSADAMARMGEFHAMVANEKDYVATRIAHRLSLTGPAISVHTACSTSLVAVTQAFYALRNGLCDFALAGGASLTVPVNSGYLAQEGGMLSADGHCRPFSAEATGTMFSDGAGVVVLRRLSDAVRDGDTIYAVIRGAALNNDGANKASFTAPSVSGQAEVIRLAQQVAGVAARSIGYVEAHGTATPLGDPIEVEALRQAFASSTQDKQFCAIGSIKSNFGHLTAAAGVAGLIKATLALHHEALPPTLHFTTANKAIDFSQTPFFVQTQLSPWPRGTTPRRAAVSSFGVGGTNAHVILEEAPLRPAPLADPGPQLLVWSARSQAALDAVCAETKLALTTEGAPAPADAAFTLQLGRRAFTERRFAVVESPAELDQAKHFVSKTAAGRPRGVAFMFPGQGAQYVGMGKALYEREPVFRAVFDECNEILTPKLGRSLQDVVFASDSEQAQAELRNTAFTQTALFSLEYALAMLWRSWGIKPQAMLGHSVGEFVAATLAGVFSLEDGLGLIATRGQLMQALPTGTMLSVRLPAAAVLARLGPTLSVASANSPDLCVIAGPTSDIEALRVQLEEERIAAKPLVTSHAFHSPMMEPAIAPFLAAIQAVPLNPPKLRIMSTVVADWLSDAQACDAHYWARHMRETVRFSDALIALLGQAPGVALLEVGPRTTLATIARQHITPKRGKTSDVKPDDRAVVASLSDSPSNEWRSALGAIGQLWASGEALNWRAFHQLGGQAHRRRVALPGYAFERKRFWIDPDDRPHSRALDAAHQPTPTANHGAPAAPPVQEPAMTDRKPALTQALAKLLEDASGLDFAAADPNASFFELGVDSLLLTQVALAVSKKFGVSVSFRQLSESLPTLGALVAHLDEVMPQDNAASTSAQSTSAQSTSAQSTSAPPAMVTNGAMGQAAFGMNGALAAAPALASAQAPATNAFAQVVIAQQLQLMQQQLAVLGGLAQQAAPQAAVMLQAPHAPPSAPQAPAHAGEDEPAKPMQYDVKKAFGAIARISTKTDEMTPKQRARYDALMQRYNARTKRSKAFTQEHRLPLADPRVVTGFRPLLKEVIYQVVVERSQGSRLWDIDGNEYVDALNGFGSNFFGNRPQFIVEALRHQLDAGYELGPQHPIAGEAAKLFCELTGLERAAFCNTGSEAVMGAMRMARTITGRNLIAIFTGSYHGIFDEVLVRGTKKLRSIPAAPGIMPESVGNVLVLDYGTDEALAILRERGSELAAIMVEPVQSRRPDFQPREFLHACRQICDAHGAALIFDEVITGFRTGPDGAQGHFGVRADIGTYGKVVGGGMPIGVIGGNRKFMDALDGGFWQFGDGSIPTVGPTYFAGTFVRHPFALAAARAVLAEMKAKGPALQREVTAKTEAFADTLNAWFKEVGAPLKIKHFASLWKTFYTEDQAYGDLLFVYLRDKGIHIWDGFPCFMTTAHTSADVALMVNAFKASVTEMQEAGFLPEAPARVAHFDASNPPVAGARLGRDQDGNPAWFVPNPNEPGKFMKVGQ